MVKSALVWMTYHLHPPKKPRHPGLLCQVLKAVTGEGASQ